MPKRVVVYACLVAVVVDTSSETVESVTVLDTSLSGPTGLPDGVTVAESADWPAWHCSETIPGYDDIPEDGRVHIATAEAVVTMEDASAIEHDARVESYGTDGGYPTD